MGMGGRWKGWSGETMILFGMYNILNGRNGGLDSAQRVIVEIRSFLLRRLGRNGGAPDQE